MTFFTNSRADDDIGLYVIVEQPRRQQVAAALNHTLHSGSRVPPASVSFRRRRPSSAANHCVACRRRRPRLTSQRLRRDWLLCRLMRDDSAPTRPVTHTRNLTVFMPDFQRSISVSVTVAVAVAKYVRITFIRKNSVAYT